MKKKEDKNFWKEYFQLGEVVKYYFRKRNPKAKTNINLRIMHGINKISIIIFLIAIMILIIRHII